MKESAYQSKIIKAIEAIGGEVVNGRYTKVGIADLVCGYPYTIQDTSVLLHLHVEVKTQKDWNRVMQSVDEVYDESVKGYRYFIKNKKYLKDHELLQVTKLNTVRDKGGLAMLAYEFKQVQEYVLRDVNIGE